ncbi:MAG: hypothetical protein HYS34_02395 [Acidobacteria bacterium]|nr:hypothetical protein [Acidobacteriota bacterium]
MTSPGQEALVLTLPGEPALARLARLVTSHFLRQNGVRAAAARRGALAVEKGFRRLIRAASRSGRGGRALVLVLQPLPAFLEVVGRAAGGPKTRLLRLVRPRPA